MKNTTMDISIKKPCHENWDNMTPNEQGAFCHKCVKSVIDFSDKTIEEIKAYFAAKTKERVCGRFREDQMTELSFDSFFERFRSFTVTKKLAIVLYFTFGVWLFSAGNANAQSEHLKGDVDVQVERDLSKVGMVKIITPDTAKCVKEPKQTNNTTKEPVIMGKIVAPRQPHDKTGKPVVEARPKRTQMKQGEVKVTEKKTK